MYKRYLLAAASVIALATLNVGQSALAFDDVDWEWDLKLDVDLEIDENIKLDVDPEGATIVEVDQEFKGDVEADADADDIKIDNAGGDVEVSNSATAIGNGVIVETETATMLHVIQDMDGDVDADAHLTDVEIDDVGGDVDVSNTAQAIANFVSLTVDPACGERCGEVDVDELFAVVDVSQEGEGDVYAHAYMDNVEVTDVRGAVSVVNSALAAGNLVSITVVRGSIETPTTP